MLALTLAAVGVYGVMSLAVAQRTQELGIRMALGAGPSRLVALILRDALNQSAAGVGCGVVAALALSPFIASQLYGVPPIDPLTFAATPPLLIAAAFLAALVPALRAMRVDPDPGDERAVTTIMRSSVRTAWTSSTFGTSRSSRTSTTASRRSPTAFSS